MFTYYKFRFYCFWAILLHISSICQEPLIRSLIENIAMLVVVKPMQHRRLKWFFGFILRQTPAGFYRR